MNKFLSLILVSFCSVGYAQEISVIKYPELLEMINESANKTRVINFWATWCGPCVKELPQFEGLNEKYKNQNTEVILVSFDFVEQLETKVKTFVNKKGLKSKIYLLDETDYNAFIDKVDPSWSGALPATMIVDSRKNKRLFLEKEFDQGELEKVYLEFIN